jgi:hypothetical protein
MQDSGAGEKKDPEKVIVVDFDMHFDSMVFLLIKISLAACVAAIPLGILTLLVWSLLTRGGRYG